MTRDKDSVTTQVTHTESRADDDDETATPCAECRLKFQTHGQEARGQEARGQEARGRCKVLVHGCGQDKSWSEKKGRGRRSGNEGDLVLVAERCGTVFRLQRVAIVIEIE